MLTLALYQPDIPQNAGAAMRLCACLGVGMDIIEPCGFIMDNRRLRRSGMDYIDDIKFTKYRCWQDFLNKYQGQQRIILLTTKADTAYTTFNFQPGDILLAGRESAGVPDEVRDAADERIVIPMPGGGRSLNVVNALAMVTGEALRQTGGFES